EAIMRMNARTADEIRADDEQARADAAERAARRASEEERRARLASLGRPVRVALVGCAATKRPGTWPARELYVSQLFRSTLARTADEVFVLSALWGLVGLDERIPSYNRTIGELRKGEREGWAARVASRLRAKYQGLDVEVSIYAGNDYAAPVEVALYRDKRMA